MSQKKFYLLSFAILLCLGSCDNSADPLLSDQYEAQRASIDRFSDEASILFQRSSNPNLPGPDEPINFDEPPFLTKGLGPNGEIVEYYNFDVMPQNPAPLYVFFRKEDGVPVENQKNIVTVIPGDEGYNDFWQIYRVFVPAEYEANSATSLTDIQEEGYEIEPTSKIVNCPIVPDGSTANKRFTESAHTGLDRGWYKGQIIYYFTFAEKNLSTTQYGSIPLSLLYVTFNVNPDKEGGGHPSGFKTEEGSNLTHNVAATTPTDDDYSPLWLVKIYDNADFEMVSDLSSARNATILSENTGLVNRPIVNKIQQ